VLRTRVVLLTNVGLEHTQVLGNTVEEIAREKLAVARGVPTVVLPDETYADLVAGGEIRIGGAHEAAEAFLGRELPADIQVALPGRFERRDAEIRDGAHNPDGMRYLVERLCGSEPQGTPCDYTVVASILEDKDVDAMLRELRTVGSRLVATSSSSPRALPADELARRAAVHFETVESVAAPLAAVARAHALGEPVLVTGSLYVLGDLAQAEEET
jgi:dihydrofolate synthase/folylpolyglutamate synthase